MAEDLPAKESCRLSHVSVVVIISFRLVAPFMCSSLGGKDKRPKRQKKEEMSSTNLS